MNGFTKKSVGTMTLGEKLKKIRSERRMSLGEVSRGTRIQVRYLEYLENGDYAKLPVDVYVKGFLRNYAEFIGADENLLLKQYEKERGIRKNIMEKNKNEKTGKASDRPKPIDISSFVITPRMIAASLVFLSVFLGVFYLYREIGSFSSAPRLLILSPTNNLSTDKNTVEIDGVTDRDAKVFINDQMVLVNDEGKFHEILAIQSGANIISVRAVNRFEKEKAEVLTVRSDYQQISEPVEGVDDVPSQVSESGFSIEVRVDPGPVWVSIKKDGNLAFSGTMLSGSIQSFQAEREVSIDSGKGEATFISFNGKNLGALKKDPGPVKGVVFDQNGAK